MKRITGAIHSHAEEQLTWWGRLWRYVCAPIFYWLDLLGPDRRPSHSKVTWTVAFAVGISLLVYVTHEILADHDAPTSTELAFLLSYASLMLATAGGLDGFKTWAKTRGGGTVDAFADTVRQATVGPGKAFEEDDPNPPAVL